MRMTALPVGARDLLWSETTLVIATEREGRPWIASAFYAPEEHDGGLRLTCAFLASSTKLANLRANPHAALFVGPRAPSRWLQAAAIATVVEDEDGARQALARLLAHAPAARVFVERTPVVPVLLEVTGLKLTDLTGERAVVETFKVS